MVRSSFPSDLGEWQSLPSPEVLRPCEHCSQHSTHLPASLPSGTFCHIHEALTQCAGGETLIASLYVNDLLP